MSGGPLSLYQAAEEMGVEVVWFPLWADRSLAVELPDGTQAVALDPWKMETLAQETTCLAHELGHCSTGSFYDPHAALDVRRRHENRADKWAIARLVPRAAFQRALSAGCDSIPALAEHFGVTEGLMRKAACWYLHGNLSPELYL